MNLNIKKNAFLVFILLLLSVIKLSAFAEPTKKQTIKALYITLDDHYAALVAYERYRKEMDWTDIKPKLRDD